MQKGKKSIYEWQQQPTAKNDFPDKIVEENRGEPLVASSNAVCVCESVAVCDCVRAIDHLNRMSIYAMYARMS